MRYEAPATLDGAVALLADGGEGARVLAGGTDLLVRMRSGHMEPGLVVDIKRIPEMRSIAEEEGGFRVGAAVSGAELNEHARFMRAFPGVAEAAGLIGSTQIQGRATIIGNLCNGSPAADSVPAMVACDGVARIVGPNGTREMPVEDVPTGPGRTVLGQGELIASVFFPLPAPKTADCYLRFIPRTEMDIAVVGAGVSITLDGAGNCLGAKVALGAVAPTVVTVPEAARALIGTKVDAEALKAVAEAASAAANPIDDKRGTVAFRRRVAGVLARRAAETALSRAKER